MESYKPIKIDTLQKTGVKSSQEKTIRKQILDSIPSIENLLDKIWPKKSNFSIGKQKPHGVIYFVNNEPCFIQSKEGLFLPHIKLLHKYPQILPTCQVDKGAIKHLITGADVMIPGMLTEGGRLPEGKIVHNIVAIMCEGKENCLAIGQMKMSAEEMKQVGKGVGITVLHYVGDNLWNVK